MDGTADPVAATFSVVQLVHRVLTDPRVAHADSGYRSAWLLYLQLAGLRPLGPPPAPPRPGGPAPRTPLPGRSWPGWPACPHPSACWLASWRGAARPGRNYRSPRRGRPPPSSALAEISWSVRDDRRWQLVVGPELRYVLQVLDTLADEMERKVLRALQYVSAGRDRRSALRAQVLSKLSASKHWGPRVQFKGLEEGHTTAAAAAGTEEFLGFLATATGELLLLDDYLLPRQLLLPCPRAGQRPVACPAQLPGAGAAGAAVPEQGTGLGGGRLGAVLSEGPLPDAQARRTPRQPGLLEQKFTNCFFNSALQFLTALLCPLPAGQGQCPDSGCLACCLVRCAELLKGPEKPVVVQYVERSYGRQGAILHVPDDPAILQAFEALSLGVRDRGCSADQPQMYELKTDSAAACVGRLLELALAPTPSSGSCSIRNWLKELFRVRYGLLGAGTEGEAPRQGPLLILGCTPPPHSTATNSVTLQNALDGALPYPFDGVFFLADEKGDVATGRQPEWLLLETQLGDLTLDFLNTVPNVLVRLEGSVKPVEFWLESACFRLEHTKPEHFVVVRRGWGGDGVHSGWHCLDGERPVSGSLWQALEGVTAGRQDAPGQRPPRPVMFLLRRRQSRTHLTIVGDAAQRTEYERDHRAWTRGVRAALTAGMPHFADLWPPERPLSESSLIFLPAGRAGTSTTAPPPPPRGPAKPAGAGPSGLAPAGSSDARRRRTAAPA
eukprot:g75337.t1